MLREAKARLFRVLRPERQGPWPRIVPIPNHVPCPQRHLRTRWRLSLATQRASRSPPSVELEPQWRGGRAPPTGSRRRWVTSCSAASTARSTHASRSSASPRRRTPTCTSSPLCPPSPPTTSTRGSRVCRSTSRRSSMNHSIKLLAAFVASVLIASIAAALALAGGSQNSGTRVAIARSRLGHILVDSKGITLYDFVKDNGTTSVCYGACAALWPPLTTSGKPVAGQGVRASLLGTTKRKDGKLEVTYNGHPLYYFVTDKKPGQTTGQGVDQFGAPWWVLSPAGKEIHRV